ncbi:MAG: hypothetical protein ACKVX7_03000 [Planctomycetota bacterium]
MTRNDWVFLFLRCYGIYLLVGAVFVFPEFFRGEAPHLSGVLYLGFQVFLGWLLGVRTGSVCSYLDRQDARLAKPQS